MLTGLDRLCVMKAKHPTILFSATVNEEFGFSGIKALTRLWSSDRADILQGDYQARELLPRIPDVAIVAEPTELNIVTTHKGATRWRIKVYGRAATVRIPNAAIMRSILRREWLLPSRRFQGNLQDAIPVIRAVRQR